MERKDATSRLRMKNMIRFRLKSLETPMDRKKFVNILFKPVGVTAEMIFCLQDYAARGIYDVTLKFDDTCDTIFRACEEHKDELPMSLFFIEPLFTREWRPLYVFMYNPYVKEEEITMFLKKYCDFSLPPVKVMDEYGLWTGKWKYEVRLRTVSSKEGGVLHPPANFEIGANRGFLNYVGQLSACFKCGGWGHLVKNCKEVICRICRVKGHVADECNVPKKCNFCGEEGHMYKSCPRRQESYAEIVKEREREKKAAKEKKEEEKEEKRGGGKGRENANEKDPDIDKGKKETVGGALGGVESEMEDDSGFVKVKSKKKRRNTEGVDEREGGGREEESIRIRKKNIRETLIETEFKGQNLSESSGGEGVSKFK